MNISRQNMISLLYYAIIKRKQDEKKLGNYLKSAELQAWEDYLAEMELEKCSTIFLTD